MLMVVETGVFAGLLRDNGNERGINKGGFVPSTKKLHVDRVYKAEVANPVSFRMCVRERARMLWRSMLPQPPIY